MTLLTLILAQSLFYPSVTELYRQGKALTLENCGSAGNPVYAADLQLIRHKKIYEKMPSASLRSNMAGWFGRSRNAKSAPLLLELLAKEKNPFVRMDLVRALQNLKKEKISYTLPESFSSYFLQKDAPAGFKAEAMILYSSFYPEKAVSAVFKAVQEDPEPYLLSAAYPLLKSHAGKLPQAVLAALYKKGAAQQYGGALHCFAASLLARQKLSPEWNKTLLRDLKSTHLQLAVRISEGLAQSPFADPEGIRSCSLDEREAVRLELAKAGSLSKVKLEALLRLSNDRSAFVQEEVMRTFGRMVRSLDRSQREMVFPALLSGLRDPSGAVRMAAVCSLTELSLSEDERLQLLVQAQSFAPAWEEVIYYAHRNRVKSYAPVIAENLDSFRKDPILLRKALLALGELHYIPSTKKVMQLASFRDPSIRQACAEVLGRFKQKISFPVLKRLLRDKAQIVAFEAAKAMFSIGGKTFTSDYLWLLRSRTGDRADQRAIAVRSLDAAPLPPAAFKDLETLLLKPCIVEPMSPPMPEIPTVRISILMLLHNKSVKKDPKASALLNKALRELSAPGKNEEMDDPVFKEYFRQFKLFRSGGKVIPGKLEIVEPLGNVQVLK